MQSHGWSWLRARQGLMARLLRAGLPGDRAAHVPPGQAEPWCDATELPW